MTVDILPVNRETLASYSTIPMRFEVRSKLEVELIADGFGGMVFRDVPVLPSYLKDYDSLERPFRWLRNFDVSNWALFVRRVDSTLIGGATVVWHTPGVDMLERRADLAVLWDIRVRPEYQRSGVGTELVRSAVQWAKEKGCHQLKIETQNTNVPACRFYLSQGCKLGAVHRFKYLGNPLTRDEVELDWFLDLKD